MPITYGSVCSGIEAATQAWHTLGMRATWFAEIEAFPSAVLAHHCPNTPNLGDMTKLGALVLAGKIDAPDVLVGGTPCQAFSVTGMRQGLLDPRGALTIKYVALADATDYVRAGSRKPPLCHRLGKRPRRPQRQRERLRMLSWRACWGRLRAAAFREKVAGRWLCVWTQKNNRMADPGRPILRPGPTTPPCVRCRKCSKRIRSHRGTF